MNKKILELFLVLACCSCTTEKSINPIANEFQYKEGQQVCVVTGSSLNVFTLTENVEYGQSTAFGKSTDGTFNMIDVPTIVDFSTCYGD